MIKRRLRAKVWWPKIDTHTEKFVVNCRGFTLMSATRPPEPIERTELPSAPWEDLAIDFCGRLPSRHHLFVIVDDCGTEIKAEGIEYIDHKRRDKMSEIEEGNSVVTQHQIKTNKLATIFELTVFTVTKRSGSEVTIENDATKTQYRRNVADVKKVPQAIILHHEPSHFIQLI